MAGGLRVRSWWKRREDQVLNEMISSLDQKYKTVLEKNTFYFFDRHFEEKYEGHLNSVKETLLVLKNEVETNGLKKDVFDKLLQESENGLVALLTLTGFSNESFKRLITLIRAVDNPELARLSCKEKWHKSDGVEHIREWSDTTIFKMLRENEAFRAGIVNIFFEGATVPFLVDTLPLFELKKFGISKLQFDINAMIDTLVRYKEKGSYSGQKGNNPETVLSGVLERMELAFESGDLSEFIERARDTKRTMDFIVPNKQNPRVIIESSFLVTTSSGQGDKSKTEIAIKKLIKKHYPDAKFIGFVDGIGWYVRKEDLKRMVAAYDDVFTFHKDEMNRFERMLQVEFGKNASKLS